MCQRCSRSAAGEQKVQFEVLRLWRGKTQLPVVASIGVAEPSGTICDGIGNLRVELRQRWLLVGNYERGVLRPSSLKSKLLVDGVLPIKTLKILQSSEWADIEGPASTGGAMRGRNR